MRVKTPIAPACHEQTLDDPVFLEELRRYMLKFANLQLNDPQDAEDVVQEAFIGALKNRASFRRAAALKTWVFAILKYKIADALRSRVRHSKTQSRLPTDEEENSPDNRFNEYGAWLETHRPGAWGDPENAMRESQFWTVFEACLDNLPGRHARIFMMREFVELDTEEICRALDMSANSVFVNLYRARVRLRECLETHWFNKGAA